MPTGLGFFLPLALLATVGYGLVMVAAGTLGWVGSSFSALGTEGPVPRALGGHLLAVRAERLTETMDELET